MDSVTAPGSDHVPACRALIRDHRGRFSVVRRQARTDVTGVHLTLTPLYVGLCGTDLDIARGRRGDAAAVLGHEGVAAVVETTGDTGLREGQLVTFNPVNERDQTDILGHSRDGLLQDLIRISATDVRRGVVLPVDPDLPVERCALIEPLGTAIYGQSLVDDVTEQRAIVISGAGPIGLLNAVHAREMGRTVILVDRSAVRLALAIRMGLAMPDDVILASDDLWSQVLDRTDGAGVDAAYVCTPRADALGALAQAVRYVRSGGCIDLVAGVDPEARLAGCEDVALHPVRWANSCGNTTRAARLAVPGSLGTVWLTGHRGTARRHLLSAMDQLKRVPAFNRVVTHVVSMEQAAQVLNACRENPEALPLQGSALKVMVDCRRP